MKKTGKIILWFVVIILAIGVIGALFGSDEETKNPQEKQTTQEEKPKASENKKEDVKADKEKEEEVKEETIPTPKKEDPNKVSDKFKTDSQVYLMELSVSYDIIGTLAEAEDEEEMMDIIEEGQRDFILAQGSFSEITPTNNKEQEIYDKLSEMNTLTESALDKAETGLINEDVDIINSATEDIIQSGDIAETIGTDLQ